MLNPNHLAWYGVNGAQAWTDQLHESVLASMLPTLDPASVKDFCPHYDELDAPSRVMFWMQLMSKIAEQESGFNPKSTYQEPGGSRGPGTLSVGLFQISYEDERPYGLEPLNRANDDLENAVVNIRCTVKMMEHLIDQDDALYGKTKLGKWVGLSRYWSCMRPDHRSFALIKSYCLGVAT